MFCLTNKYGFRCSCSDIRSKGGYIIDPNSQINKNNTNDNQYQHVVMPTNSIICAIRQSTYRAKPQATT